MLKITTILFCIFSFSKAHVNEVNFYLIDKSSNEKIEFALCYLEESKISTMSNENGFFSFHILSKYNSDTLFIQHLSYHLHKIILDEIKDTIFLKRKDNNLSEVPIYALKAINIVENSIKNISKNYNQKSYYIFGKYRQIHLENSLYSRFIEAFSFIHFEEKSYKNQKENFLIKEIRRSYNFEKNGEKHGDHLVDLFLENPIRYPSKSFLNYKNIHRISWEIESENEIYYWISFQNKKLESVLNYFGNLKINKLDFALLYFEVYSSPSIFYNTKSNWKLITNYISGSFTKKDGFYNLESLKRNYVHEIYNEKLQSIERFVEERFFWETYDIEIKKPTQGFKKRTNLYTQPYKYQGHFWQNIQIDDAIIKDLSRNKNLETQFQDGH